MGMRAGEAIPGTHDGFTANTSHLLSLAPRQLADELTLAKREYGVKGRHLGTGAVGLVFALVFLSMLVTALLVAAIMGVAVVMPAWLAALIVAAVFLVLVGVGALVGFTQFRRAMPLVPAEAWRGLRHDLGVLREGTAFDPSQLDRSSRKQPSDDSGEKSGPPDTDGGPDAEVEGKMSAREELTTDQLRDRLSERREHLLHVRDALGRQVNIPRRMRTYFGGVDTRTYPQWLPWGAFAGFVGVFLLLLKRLLKK